MVYTTLYHGGHTTLVYIPTLYHPGYTLVYISYPVVYRVLHSVSAVSNSGALGSKKEKPVGKRSKRASQPPNV